MGIKVGCTADLSGKVAVVTGCNTGIGLQTAKMLCDAGAHVVLACRSKERAKPALATVVGDKTRGTAEIIPLDLGDVDSIKAFAASFAKKHAILDILVNNAGLNTTGAYRGPRVTKQGYEICMGTNYLGHFMLTALLAPALMASADARVVALSSVTTWFASNKYQHFIKGASKTNGNYAASKLACLAFTIEAQKRLDAHHPDNNVRFVAADPGFVMSDVWRNYNVVFRTVAGALALNTAQGAMTSVSCATRDKAKIKGGGLYMPFSGIKMSRLFKMNKSAAYNLGMPFLTKLFAGFGPDAPAPKAKSAEATEQLWGYSVQFCKDNGVTKSILLDF
jgi:retinol dehydrogenase-12